MQLSEKRPLRKKDHDASPYREGHRAETRTAFNVGMSLACLILSETRRRPDCWHVGSFILWSGGQRISNVILIFLTLETFVSFWNFNLQGKLQHCIARNCMDPGETCQISRSKTPYMWLFHHHERNSQGWTKSLLSFLTLRSCYCDYSIPSPTRCLHLIPAPSERHVSQTSSHCFLSDVQILELTTPNISVKWQVSCHNFRILDTLFLALYFKPGVISLPKSRQQRQNFLISWTR